MANFSFACSYNRTNYEVDTTDFTFCKLEQILTEVDKGAKGVIHKIDGFFITPSIYGDQPIMICSELKKLVNMPYHMLNLVNKVNSDAEAIEAIKGGKVGFVIEDYNAHGKVCYGVKFVDL